MRQYEVGAGDSPTRIAKEHGLPLGALLEANPHKSIIFVRGTPTFDSIGIGEKLTIPIGIASTPQQVPTTAGWTTPGRELITEFTNDQHRAPNTTEIGILMRLAKRNNDILVRPNIKAGHPSRADEMDFNTAQGLINFFLVSGRGPDHGDPAGPPRGGPEIEALVKAAVGAVPSKQSLLGSITHAISKIPVVGDVAHIVVEAAAAPFNVAAAVASGERLDHVALGALKAQINIVKDVAPYAQTVVSLVPGVGTGVAAAIGAGAALAEGQSITAAVKAGIRGAIPGGALGASAFDLALKVAGGENVGQAALESARSALPPGAAQQAFDIGLAVVTGEKIQTALAKGLADIAPGQLQTILAAGQQALSATPGLASAIKNIAAGAPTEGFTLAAGLLSHSGMNQKALTAVRDQLAPDVRQGFDAALATQAPHTAWLKNVVPVVVATSNTPQPAPPKAPVIHELPKKPIAAQPSPVRAPVATVTAPVPAAPASAYPVYSPYPPLGVGASISDRLLPGQELAQGQELRTSNGGRLVLQTDGNFVLYAPDGHAIWATDTQGKPVTRAVMQKDGNLVMRSPLGYGGIPEGQGWWDSGTAGRGVTQLVLQTDGNLVWYKGDAKEANAISNTGTHNWAKSPHWQTSSGNILTTITNAVSKIPVVGDVAHIIGEAAVAPLHIATAIASGERLDHVALGALKAQLNVVKEAAPYAATVVSFVPGIGTGVAAAIGAGAALAEGQSITEAAKAAIRSAVPGGAIGVAAYDTAVKVAAGENIGQAAIETARSALPASAQKAFDIGVAVVTGEKIQTAIANGLASIAPEGLQAVLAAGQRAITATPGLSNAIKGLAPGAATQGFTIAAGLLGHAGASEKALTAVRDQLPADVRQGFDAALKTQEPHVAWLKNVTSAPATPSATNPAIVAATRIVAATPATPHPTAPKIVEPAKPASRPAPPKIVEPAPKITEPVVAQTRATPAPAIPPQPAYGPYPNSANHGALSGCRSDCTTWGPPVVGMSRAMEWAGRSAVNGSKGQPRMVRGPDGVTYRFAIEDGALSARPCADADTGVGAAEDKSPLDSAWFLFRFFDRNTGAMTDQWGPFYTNVGAVSIGAVPAMIGKALLAPTRTEIWIYEASHDNPSVNIWRIFSRSD